MNDQTGELYRFRGVGSDTLGMEQEIKEKLKELDDIHQTMTKLIREPDEKCLCCKGTGSVQVKIPWSDEKGIVRRYIPCFCTFREE